MSLADLDYYAVKPKAKKFPLFSPPSYYTTMVHVSELFSDSVPSEALLRINPIFFVPRLPAFFTLDYGEATETLRKVNGRDSFQKIHGSRAGEGTYEDVCYDISSQMRSSEIWRIDDRNKIPEILHGNLSERIFNWLGKKLYEISHVRDHKDKPIVGIQRLGEIESEIRAHQDSAIYRFDCDTLFRIPGYRMYVKAPSGLEIACTVKSGYHPEISALKRKHVNYICTDIEIPKGVRVLSFPDRSYSIFDLDFAGDLEVLRSRENLPQTLLKHQHFPLFKRREGGFVWLQKNESYPIECEAEKNTRLGFEEGKCRCGRRYTDNLEIKIKRHDRRTLYPPPDKIEVSEGGVFIRNPALSAIDIFGVRFYDIGSPQARAYFQGYVDRISPYLEFFKELTKPV